MPEKKDILFDDSGFDQPLPGWQSAAERLGTLWCILMHDSPSWPIHGQYRCGNCGRHFPVLWGFDHPLAVPTRPIPSAPPGVRQAGIPRLQFHLLPIFIALSILMVSPLLAADPAKTESNSLAALALARYTANLERTSSWNLETVEIDASLPKLEKRGRLRAVRRLLPLGKPEYRVIELSGDKTVRQQVILRYLTAEVRAAAIPFASTAITPANYKFRYKGFQRAGDSIACVFLVSPRKKRDGLIKGELWLDSKTGVATRQSGYLVRNPSLFVKRIDITREVVFQGGEVQMRVTHLSVETRLVGRAELTIQEFPCTTSDFDLPLVIADQ